MNAFSVCKKLKVIAEEKIGRVSKKNITGLAALAPSFPLGKLQTALLTSMLVGALSGFAPQALAECDGIRCYGKINRLFTHPSSGNVFIDTDGDENRLDCVADGGRYIALESSRQMFAQMYDSLLEGLTTGKNMTIRITTGSNPCRVQYVTIDRIAL